MYVCNRYIYFYRAREAKCDVRNESRWQTVTAAARSRFFGERRKFPEELRGDYSSLPPLTPILALKVDTIEDTSNTRLSIFRTDFGRPVSWLILIEKLHVTLHFVHNTRVSHFDMSLALRHRSKKKKKKKIGGYRGKAVTLEDDKQIADDIDVDNSTIS